MFIWWITRNSETTAQFDIKVWLAFDDFAVWEIYFFYHNVFNGPQVLIARSASIAIKVFGIFYSKLEKKELMFQ